MIEYVVPSVNDHGGIQQFALAQIPYFEDVKVTDWRESRRLVYRLGMRLLPAPVSARLIAGRRPPTVPVHYWHVGAAMGQDVSRAVITCHGSELLAVNTPGQRKVLVANALRGAASVTANSNYTARLLASRFALSGVAVIHPAVVRSEYSRRGDHERFTVGTLSRLVPRKNVLTLVESLSLLASEGVDLHYRLAGDGPERSAILERLRRSGISYEYLGPISEERKLREFYPSLDVFALPVRPCADDVEGFGIVFLEAAASGVPSVASRVGGIEDAVSADVSGCFADPLDPGDIAYAILRAGKLPDQGVVAWANGFSPSETARRFESEYEKII